MEDSQIQLVEKYLNEVNNGIIPTFDVDEYEEIIAYFEETEAFTEAIHAIDCGLINYPGDEDLLARKAKNYIYLVDYPKAKEILSHLSRENDFVMMVWAEFYLSQSKDEKCIEILETLITQFGADPMIYLDISDFLNSYDEGELAIDFLTRGLEYHPDNLNLMCELSLLYEDFDQWEQNIELVNKLIDSDPYNIVYWLALARCYRNLGDYAKCIEACEYGVTIDESNVEAHLMIGETFYKLESYHKAKSEFLNIAETHRRERPAMLSLAADCCIRMGETDEAFRLVDQAIKCDPDYSHAYYMKATLYFIAENYTEALRQVEKVIELDPKSSEGYFLLSEIYTALEFFDLSQEMLRKAVKTDPFKVFIQQPRLKEMLLSDSHEKRMQACEELIATYPEVLLFKVVMMAFAFKQYDLSAIDTHLEEFRELIVQIGSPNVIDEEPTPEQIGELISIQETFIESLRAHNQ